MNYEQAIRYAVRTLAKSGIKTVSYESGKIDQMDVAVRCADVIEQVKSDIRNGEYSLALNPEKQARHMAGTAIQGRSVVTISMQELQEIINKQAGVGRIQLTRENGWKHQEIVDAGREIGYTVNENGDTVSTSQLKIHYSKTGIHAVPYKVRR